MKSKNHQLGHMPKALLLLTPLLLFFCLPSATHAATCGCEEDTKAKVAQPVTNYDNGGEPLIPTLLSIADSYGLPMGIERVTREALTRPLKISLPEGDVSRLLDLCVKQVPGYAWAVHDDTVHVFGEEELTQPSNLFNLVAPSFEIHEQTLNTADEKLSMTVLIEVEHPRGIVGSYLPSSELEDKRMTFAARNATVREILNRLVRLHGNSVWIARVPPERLSRLPQAGLWKFLPHSTHDPRALLEPFPQKDVSQDKVR